MHGDKTSRCFKKVTHAAASRSWLSTTLSDVLLGPPRRKLPILKINYDQGTSSFLLMPTNKDLFDMNN